MKFTRKYFKSAFLITSLICLNGLFGCFEECYETAEPEVYITIKNSCLYESIKADGIRQPLTIRNDCDSNSGMATITLPLLENRKTYFLTDGFNTIDSFTINYTLTETLQNDCGYVVILQDFSVDSTASSVKFYHTFNESPNDTINTHIIYSTHADYMEQFF